MGSATAPTIKDANAELRKNVIARAAILNRVLPEKRPVSIPTLKARFSKIALVGANSAAFRVDVTGNRVFAMMPLAECIRRFIGLSCRQHE